MCIIAEAFERVFQILNQQPLIRVILLWKACFIQANFSLSWVSRSSLNWLMPLVCQPITALDRVQRQARPCGCVVNKGALGQVFLRVLRLSPASITPLMLHTHSLIHHRRNVVVAIETAFKYRTLTHASLNSYPNSIRTGFIQNSQFSYPTQL